MNIHDKLKEALVKLADAEGRRKQQYDLDRLSDSDVIYSLSEPALEPFAAWADRIDQVVPMHDDEPLRPVGDLFVKHVRAARDAIGKR